MDARQFVAEFGHIAHAPGGVARLRELVLSFAVRGHLVSQAVNMHNTKIVESLISERKKIQSKVQFRILSGIESTDTTFEIPKNWTWVRLGEVVEVLDSLRQPITKQSRKTGLYPYYGASGVVDYVADFIFDEPLVLVGEDGAKWGRGENSAFKITGKTWVNNHAHVLRPLRDLIQDEYLVLSLVEADLGEYITGMTVPKLNQARLISVPVPLPPLEEQSRIVAKVDELMALCDKLEAQQQERRTLQNALRQSTLQAVAAAATPHELHTTWTRLAENFGRLFQAPEDVAELQHAFANLAVRGLLTEQDPSEEPASHLLERIAVENQKLVLTGELKRQKPLPQIDLNDTPFELPKGWAWARFPELGVFGRGKSKHRPRNDPRLFSPGVYPLVQTGEVARAKGVITEYHSKYSEVGLAQSKMWPKGTLCITIAANIADSAILGFDACFPDSVVGFVPGAELREEIEYFLLFMKTAREQLLAFAPSTAQKNINLEILQSVLVPVPPKEEMKRILKKIREINALCEQLAKSHMRAQDVGKLLATAAVSCFTGITTEQEDEPMKTPQTELIASLRLGQTPDIKAQAPLAAILASHNGEMGANDLWRRFGGEIDAFYAQLKTEVSHGWILEPSVAEMRVRDVS